jgi:hypothetical protein
MIVIAEILAGAGLGALVGLLLSLSMAQAVGGVIAALAALLGGFFGLARADSAGLAVRIGFFGIFCVAGVIAGLMLRNGGKLVPSVQGDVAEWTAAGYPPEEARQWVALQRLGVKPENATLVARPASTNALFADVAAVCGRLEQTPGAGDRLRILREQGGALAGLAAAAQASSDPAAALAAGLKALCG